MSHIPASFGRRRFLVGAAAVGLAVVPGLAAASASVPPRARRITTVTRPAGAFQVVALLDASGPFFLRPDVAFPNATAAAWQAAERLDPEAFGAGGVWNLDFRCFAIRGPGDRLILVDTGVGPADSPAAAWAPVPGRLPEELAAAGIDPHDVDVVVLTHLHEDHFGWSVDGDGRPLFPNARYVVQQGELDALPAGDLAVQYVVAPLQRAGVFVPVDGRVLLPEGSGGLGDSVVVVPTPGHTPGHQSVVVESHGEQIVVTGDVLVHAVQVVDPDVGYRYESDQETARRTRRALLAEARGRRASLASAHLTRPFIEVP